PAVVALKAHEKPHGRAAVGGVLVGLGLAAAGGAIFLANADDGRDFHRYGGRGFLEMRGDPDGSRLAAARILAGAAIMTGTAGVLLMLSSSPDPDATKVG